MAVLTVAVLTLAALTKAIIEYFKPDVLVGAVGRAPGCFTKEVVEAMVAVQEAKGAGGRPIIFALSNPKTQAEITAADCYKFSNGKAIFGSGTRFFRGGRQRTDARARAGERLCHLPRHVLLLVTCYLPLTTCYVSTHR